MIKNIQQNALFQRTSERLRLKILEHGYGTVGPWWAGKNLTLPFNRLHIFYGEGGALIDGRGKHRFKRGLAVLSSPRCRYEQVWEKPFQTLYIHFHLELLPTVDAFSPINHLVSRTLSVAELSQALPDNMLDSSLSLQVQAHSQLLSILAPFIKPLEPAIERQRILGHRYRDLFSRLEADFQAGTKVETLAAGMALQPRSLQQAFRRDMGQTLKAWLDHQVVERAKGMLLCDPRRVKELAYNLGFSDEHYFSRFFKRHTGISPTEYRQEWESQFSGRFETRHQNSFRRSWIRTDPSSKRSGA